MDGKDRALDNIYIERFWGSLKREKIYLNPPNDGIDLYSQIKDYVLFYNTERRHKSIGTLHLTKSSIWKSKMYHNLYELSTIVVQL
jgi:transposase InsO family protein